MNPLSRFLILPSALLIISNQSEAVNIRYAIEAGVNYSDNITRTETNQLKDTVASVVGNINVTDESSKHDFNMGLNLERLDYKDDTFDDQTNLNLNLASTWGLVDDAFTWTLDGYYGQQAISAFIASTPSNQQDTGFLSTGPNLVIRFTSLDSLTLAYRYNDFYAEDTQVDYQSDFISASLTRRVNPLLVVSLNASYDDLAYEDDVNNDFEDTRYSVSLSSTSVTTQYLFEYGQIEIDFENGDELVNDLKRFTFARQLNRRNSISLAASETIDNGAQAVTPDVVSTGVAADLYVNELVQVNYDHTGDVFQFGLSYAYSNQDYVTQDSLDQRIRLSSMNAAYGSPLMFRYTLNYEYADIDFYGSGQENKETTISVSLEKQLTRSISVIASLENYVRESNIAGQNAEDNTYMLTFRHRGRI